MKVKFIASIAYLARADDQNRTVARYQKFIVTSKSLNETRWKEVCSSMG